MKPRRSSWLVQRNLCLIVLGSALCAGCVPIVIPIDMVVAKSVSVPLGDLQPGMPLPPDVVNQQTEFCADWPSMDSLKAEIGKVVGAWILDMVDVTSIKPESVTVTASQGNFGSLEALTLSATLPDGSEVVVDAASADEAGTTLVFRPKAPLDLNDVLKQYGGERTCVQVGVAASGSVPAPNPVFDVRVKGSVTLDLLMF